MTQLVKRDGPIGLLKIEEACQLLAQCKRVDEAKSIRDKAMAVAIYLRQSGAASEAVADAGEIKDFAEERMADLLAAEPAKASGRGAAQVAGGTTPHLPLRSARAAMAKEAGLSRDQRKRLTKIAKLPADERVKRREANRKRRMEDKPSPTAHVSKNTGEVEWYTPLEYLDAARAVLGTFDLDPATSEIAQRSVKATRFFTAKDDGLAQPWNGRIWMNPPYAAGLVDRFIDKLVGHLKADDVKEAIVLVNNATDTAWFQVAAQHASAICFPKGRIRFVDANGNPGGAPLQGQAILYFGRNFETFEKHFRFGFCVRLPSR